MHYLCLIYVLKSSDYLSNVPSYVKTWKLSAVIHVTCSKHISGQEVMGDHRSLSQESLVKDAWQRETRDAATRIYRKKKLLIPFRIKNLYFLHELTCFFTVCVCMSRLNDSNSVKCSLNIMILFSVCGAVEQCVISQAVILLPL